MPCISFNVETQRANVECSNCCPRFIKAFDVRGRSLNSNMHIFQVSALAPSRENTCFSKKSNPLILIVQFLSNANEEFITSVIKSQESEFPRPLALQCMSWPILLSGRDLIAVSNSGYGKHLAVSFIKMDFIETLKLYLKTKQKRNALLCV